MRVRALALVVAAAALTLPPPAGAAYAGTVRVAHATARLRGIDGHVYRLGFDVRSSGLGGTDDFHQLHLTVTDCAGARCGAPTTYVRTLTGEEYGESFDLSLTQLSVPFGALRLLVVWSSEAGWGKVPPAVDPTGGARIATTQPAVATLLAGNDVKGGVNRYARCVDRAAAVSTTVTATPADVVTTDRWPARTPAGLAVKLRGRHYLTCA